MNTAKATRSPALKRTPVPSNPLSYGARLGVTLVELMVAMVIISILSSLSLAGLAVARTSAKRAKTVSTIRKLSEIILPYYEEYETRRPAITPSANASRAAITIAKQTAVRRLMALELPERASDYRDAFTVASGIFRPSAYTLSSNGATVALTDTPPSARRYYSLTSGVGAPQSSELLHLIVTRGHVADPDIISHFRNDEIGDFNGNGLPEFVDGWNKPIAFRRWPVGFLSPMQPIDGNLSSIDTLVSNKGHRLVPLILSAGPDGVYDIVNEPGSAPVSYSAVSYDPFAIDPVSPTDGPLGMSPQSPVIAGSVVLSPAVVSSGALTGPLVFSAVRLAGGATMSANAFQTIGSERDIGSEAAETTPNGILESRDNITNHDMTR
ncbi:MAG: prepilin-type N-terminal cleavage/methylation domain-containing protein [Verrucomicrobiales bacterium]